MYYSCLPRQCKKEKQSIKREIFNIAEHNNVYLVEKKIENVVALKMSLRMSKSGTPNCRLTLSSVQLPYLTHKVLNFILSELLDIPCIWNCAIESFPTVSCVIFFWAKFGCAVSIWSFWKHLRSICRPFLQQFRLTTSSYSLRHSIFLFPPNINDTPQRFLGYPYDLSQSHVIPPKF